MAISSAEKMRRYRAKLKRHGLVQVQGWVSPEKAELINRIISDESGHTIKPILIMQAIHAIDELQLIRARWEQLVLSREKKTRWEKCTLLLRELGQVLDKSVEN
jgi:hypothetical protein